MQNTLVPIFRDVYELSRSIRTSSVNAYHSEYPSAAFLSSTVAFVADGNGCMYVLNIPASGTGHATLLGSYELPSNDPARQATPFRIHNAAETPSQNVTVILSSRCYEEHAENSKVRNRRKTAPVEFDIWAVRFSLPFVVQPQDQAKSMEVIWHRRGDHVPISADYSPSENTFRLLGGSVYRHLGNPAPSLYEPTADEIAPIPRQNETLDTKQTGHLKPPSYSWTQTDDEVTVAFPLPSNTDKAHIKVSFSSRTLTIHIHENPSALIPPPHYSMKQLWDSVQPSSSFWTWDRNAENSFGLLTLHLEKQSEGRKWMHVFSSAGNSVSPVDESDIDVPETLDPSELWKIRESLEKYTGSLQDGEDSSGLGLGRGVPSLAEGEMDEDVDASVGRQAYLTSVSEDGSTCAHSDELPFNLLSTMVPGTNPSDISLIIKHGLDGTVFTLTPTENAATWTHNMTFSALAFVLASKQDTRFTYHVPMKAVFAFENGMKDRGGNVYIYRSAAISDIWAKQSVLKVGDGASGSLLGVGALRIDADRHALLCLCEGELVIICNVL